ncbi:hypothetical protein [Streptomyces sp. NPDC016845]|uniref:hypothetical protein n=1 Tax=Streptomyces sp. NPDC016845 TaxID=3364972 RepID=UPI0037AC8838
MSRTQVADRLPELGSLYAANCGTEPYEEDGRTRVFLRRLRSDIRRPGFALLVAENETLTAFSYGFPLHAGFFEIRAIVVPHRVRAQSPGRDWNLARRLQRRLLLDHGHATGLTLVDGADTRTLVALRSWGWRDTPPSPYRAPPRDACRVLLLGP